MIRTINFTGTKEQAKAKVRSFVRIMAGDEPDLKRFSEGVRLSIGLTALADIVQAYVIKADGGTDAMGVSWPDLKPETKAYQRRFGPGEKSRLKAAAGLGKGHRLRGLLSKAQDKQWRALFVSRLNRLKMSMDESEAKPLAAQFAWAVMKKRGAKTMLMVFGQRKVQILRDTGRLLNSISPGELTGDEFHPTYRKPAAEGGDEQIMDVSKPGNLTVGTNVKYARSHNEGDKTRGVPERRIFPKDDSQVPRAWWDNWKDGAANAMGAAMELHFQ